LEEDEEYEETSDVGEDHIHIEQNNDTYVTPNTEVHFGVFVDELLGDTIVEVTSPISGKKMKTQKRAAPLCIGMAIFPVGPRTRP